MAGLAIPLSYRRAAASDALSVTFDGDNLHVTAQGLHFLEGKSLERVKNGHTAVFLSQFTLFSDNFTTELRRGAPERLVVSYALWEERFSVVIPGLAMPPSAPLVTAEQAEAFAFENLAISTMGLPPDRPFWISFELRTVPPRDATSVLGASGISLRNIFEVVSRKAGPELPSWRRNAGPLRLAELPRIAVRGSRAG